MALLLALASATVTELTPGIRHRREPPRAPSIWHIHCFTNCGHDDLREWVQTHFSHN
jgi:hypothetical protein